MANKSEQIQIRVTSSQRDRWEEHAARDKRTLADWIRIQVDESCDRLEKQEVEREKS